MEQKKTVPNKWGIWDWPLLIEYLEEMALSGWMLTDYHEKTLGFVQIQPEKIKYAVTFFKEYNPDGYTPPEDLVYMWQMCETDGWKNVTNNNYIQIFYNRDPDAPPFHTDAVVQYHNFNSMIESSLVQKWKYNAYLMFLFAVIYMGNSVPKLVRATTEPAYRATLMVFMTILGVFFLYEMVYSLFRWHKYRQWRRIAQVYAEKEDVFMAPYDNPFYDKLNFAVTVAFCICFGGAVIVLGAENNPFGVDGCIVAMDSIYLFVMSRILVSLRLVRMSDEGVIVPVKDKYPSSTAMFILGASFVVWMIAIAGWTPNIF